MWYGYYSLCTGNTATIMILYIFYYKNLTQIMKFLQRLNNNYLYTVFSCV